MRRKKKMRKISSCTWLFYKCECEVYFHSIEFIYKNKNPLCFGRPTFFFLISCVLLIFSPFNFHRWVNNHGSIRTIWKVNNMFKRKPTAYCTKNERQKNGICVPGAHVKCSIRSRKASMTVLMIRHRNHLGSIIINFMYYHFSFRNEDEMEKKDTPNNLNVCPNSECSENGDTKWI